MLKSVVVNLVAACECSRYMQAQSPGMGAKYKCACGRVYRVTAMSRTMTDTKSVGSFCVEEVSNG